MHSDGLLDNHVGVLLSGVKVVVLSIQSVEARLDAGTTGKFGADGASVLDTLSSGVVLTLNLVLVSLDELSDHVPEKVHLLSLSLGKRRTQVEEFALGLLQLVSNLLDNFRQVVLDVSEQDLGELGSEHSNTQEARGHGRVDRVSVEVKLFLGDGLLDGKLVNDILLSSVLDTDETESELDFLVEDHALGVGTSVHDIDLGDDTNSSNTLGVELTSHLETIGGGHIGVGGHDAKNNGSGVRNVSVGHGLGDLLNVIRLVTQGDTGDTGQIDKSQIGASVGVHLQHDGLVDDVLGATSNLVSQFNNVVADLSEVSELLVGDLIGEHSPRSALLLHMVKSQLKRTSGNNTLRFDKTKRY